MSENREEHRGAGRLPEWARRPAPTVASTVSLKKILRTVSLNTVCEEARCPNIAECFGRGTATFMILGDVCTRGCRFCAVTTGKPSFHPQQFEHEGENVALAAAQLGLRHVVVTSVARDDLADGGASGFGYTIDALRRKLPEATVEVLIPDFRGDDDALQTVVMKCPDVLNHNLETVPRLYRRVRPGALYTRSLALLARAHALRPQMIVKTGIMLGLGEHREEVMKLMEDARACGVESFTAGQYLQPSREHLPVHEYLPLSEFDWYREQAIKLFPTVAIGPLVRSSYHADELISEGRPQ